MQATSAGLLPYHVVDGVLHVWLAHMGGPFWAGKDEGSWTVVKGEFQPPEDASSAAHREWEEETGSAPPPGAVELGEFVQSSRKRVTVFVAEVTDPATIAFVASSMFAMEWPPRSGRTQEFPEIDRGQWFPLDEARMRILRGQLPVLDALQGRT